MQQQDDPAQRGGGGATAGDGRVSSLEEKLEKLLKWKSELTLPAAPSAPRQEIVVTVPTERKLRRFSDSSSGIVNDWIFDARLCVKHMKPEEAVSFVLRHLDGAAREEIKCHELRQSTNVEQIFEVLQSCFGEKCSSAQLKRMLYDRRQGDRETLREFSLALTELIDRLIVRDVKVKREREDLLIEVFSENVKDKHLRRELKKTVRDRPDIRFIDLRTTAMQWAEEDENIPRAKADKREVEAQVYPSTDAYRLEALEANVAALVQCQQDFLYKMSASGEPPRRATEDNRRSTGPADRNGPKPLKPEDVLCYFCKKQGHYQSGCPAKVWERSRQNRGRRGENSRGPGPRVEENNGQEATPANPPAGNEAALTQRAGCQSRYATEAPQVHSPQVSHRSQASQHLQTPMSG